MRPVQRAAVVAAVLSALSAVAGYSAPDRVLALVVALDELENAAPSALCPVGFLPDLETCVPFANAKTTEHDGGFEAHPVEKPSQQVPD